jgi:hypothetical protein
MAFGFVLYDPEYTTRLALLNARLAEAPDRALWLMVGSSRTKTAFRPENLRPLTTQAGRQLLAFNFSHPGASPLINRLTVERLLQDGIRPAGMIVELIPAMLTDAAGSTSLDGMVAARDLPVLRRYLPAPQLYGRYALRRLVLEHRHQLDFLLRQGQSLGVPGVARSQPLLNRLGGLKGLRWTIDAAQRRSLGDLARHQYAWALQDFHIDPAQDWALRDLLHLCRQRHIAIVMLLTPEASEFRNWYSPAAVSQLDTYLARLRHDYGATIIDGRGWLPDADFTDGHHVLRRGARAFTARLEREVLRPLVAGLSPDCAGAEGIAQSARPPDPP